MNKYIALGLISRDKTALQNYATLSLHGLEKSIIVWALAQIGQEYR